MELSILYKLEIGKMEKVIDVGVCETGEEELLVLLVENGWGRELRNFYI